MSSTVFAIHIILFLDISQASVPSYFNPDESDRSLILYRGIMDIFTDNSNAPSLKVIGLIKGDTEELKLPVKMLHEFETMIVIWQNEPVRTDCTFVEIKYRQGDDVGEILADILPRVVAAFTVVFILKNPEDFSLNEIETFMLEVFKKFWEESMTNVAISFFNIYKNASASSPSLIRVLTYVYEPYNPEPLRNVTGKKYRGTFYDKAANFHLHPLRILANAEDRSFIENGTRASESSGINSYLMKNLWQIFNATIKISYRVKTDVLSHDERLKELSDLYKSGSVDLGMNLRIIHSGTYPEITFTYPMQQSNVVCILPKNRYQHVQYKSIGGGRVVAVALLMSILFIVISIFVFLSNVILKMNLSILKLPKLLMNQSDVVVHKPSSTTMRVLLGTWMIISFVCSTTLQTLITSRIIRPSVDDRLTTIDEVLESDFHLRIERAYWKLTKDHYDDDMLASMWNDIDVVENGDLFKVQDPDIGYVASEYTGRFIHSSVSQFYVLQQVFLPNYLGYYFPKNSPLIMRFDTAVREITETGILAKWLADLHRGSIITLKVEDKVSTTKYITFKNLSSVMYLYFVCTFLAFLVFVCELKFR